MMQMMFHEKTPKQQSVHQYAKCHQKHQTLRQQRQSVCGVIGASHTSLYDVKMMSKYRND